MAQPPFPCFAWRSQIPIDAKELLQSFLKLRSSSQWVMIADGCVQSNLQLWTAWTCASRRWIRGNSLARSIDAEFLRYLSGTHHVSEAFKRAGIRDNDHTGYIVFLPTATTLGEDQTDFQAIGYDFEEIEIQAASIFSSLELESFEQDFVLSKSGAIRLGMRFDSEQEVLTESSLIGHILSSEFTS